ncbi:MAG TPA: hypothetical protein VFL64_13280 [Rhizobacter sp.]|nr:hypothetical protein [Rhizobacter sp.]
MKAAERGAATVAITLLMAFVILLSVAFAHRSVLFEARTSINQYRAAQASEAAEAGIDWALAQLNSSEPTGSDCTAFRERSVSAMQATCVANESGWACQCPGNTPSTSHRVAFSIAVAATDPPDTLQLTSTGFSHSSRAQLQVRLGRLPGLDTLPAAALTVRGSVNFVSGAFDIRHTSAASGGLTLHSGGAIEPGALRLTSTPGTPASASVLSQESTLAQLTPTGLFASLFRMSREAWRAQPMARELDCSQACDASLQQAAARHQLIWLRGGLKLDSSTVLGTPQRPLLLVADGPVELQAGAVIHGLVYGTDPRWSDAAGATVHGAVVIEGDFQASGSTQIQYDAAVLKALHQHTGSYARMPGSWRDH